MPDYAIRLAAFDWLGQQVEVHGGTLSRTAMVQGFKWRGERIALMGPQGIFKPKLCDYPLSITTAPHGPYPDKFSGELLLYRYRGENPHHYENVGLRECYLKRLPLVYFFGLAKNRYEVLWPVFIVGDNPKDLTFTVAIDDHKVAFIPTTHESPELWAAEEQGAIRRAYITAQVKVRLHQRSFRERVLRAYREQCAFCRLKHEELLDAAHIIPDSDLQGEPIVSNGLSLCKLHHAAFDSHFLGLTPDYVIRVRQDILQEPDGPIHQHGLKALEGKPLEIRPRSRSEYPDQSRLEKRYELFLSSA